MTARSSIQGVSLAERNPGTVDRDDLPSALRWLDVTLTGAVARFEADGGPKLSTDPYRGLYISREDVDRALGCPPTSPVSINSAPSQARRPDVSAVRLPGIARAFGLSPFDADLLVIALAVELDLRYERVYAYLQDDVTRRRPSVDLALNLLCRSAEEKLARRVHFAPTAPLVHRRVVHLLADPSHLMPPLLGHYLKADDQVVRQLLDHEGLDRRLAPFCELIMPAASLDTLPLPDQARRGLQRIAQGDRKAGERLWLYFRGPRGSGRRRTAEAVASAAGQRLLVADLRHADGAEVDLFGMVLARDAWFHHAVVYLDEVDALRTEERLGQFERLLRPLADGKGIIILAGHRPWWRTRTLRELGADPLTVDFSVPDHSLRQTCWHTNLAAAGISIAPADLNVLADIYKLTDDEIADAVGAAQRSAQWRAAAQDGRDGLTRSSARPTVSELFAAARAQPRGDIETLARKIEPRQSWDDIILPPDQLAQLREIIAQARSRQIVYEVWGFGRKLSYGKGLTALFSGPPGTGKTMAAEVIANDLQLDLYRIDLSQVVSKYIGETEKNLDRIFTAAERASGILFFDEADALFGKRSEVRDAHDRYANIEISYLLQKMEEFEGIAILATNLRQHMDEAFLRRLQVVVEFPFPDTEHRRRIWGVSFPQQAPLAADVDFDALARAIRLAGGNIKNIALAAAFAGAADGGAITMAHLLHAAQREYQKLGQTMNGVGTVEESAGS